MPFTSNPLTLTAPIQTAIANAIEELREQAATIGTVNITKSEKNLPSINNIREPYARRMILEHAVTQPLIVPGFVNLDNSTARLNNANYFRSVGVQLKQVLEMFEDLSFNEDVPCYKDFLAMYDQAKLGAINNLPGADAIVADIAPLFELSSEQPDVTP